MFVIAVKPKSTAIRHVVALYKGFPNTLNPHGSFRSIVNLNDANELSKARQYKTLRGVNQFCRAHSAYLNLGAEYRAKTVPFVILQLEPLEAGPGFQIVNEHELPE